MTYYAKKTILMLAVIAFAAGCGKKSENTATVAPPVDAVTAPATAPSVAAPPVVVQNVDQSLAQVDAALKARAYEQAVRTLLAVQQQKALSEQQALEAANRMRGLQANLAAAIAAGDPAAKAAGALLHQANMHY